MKSRIGKIARLPLGIRTELNTRLSEGETAHLLIAWLNTNPAVLAVLNTHFHGQLVSENEIAAWRRGGYMEWALVRECAATARGLSESSEDLAATGISAEHLLTVLTVQFAKLLKQLEAADMESGHSEGLDRKLNLLRKLTNAALALRRREFQAARIEIARGRLELAREREFNKSATSRSSAASASTESAAAPQKKTSQNAVSQKTASQNANPLAAPAALRPQPSDLLPPLSALRFPVSKTQPPILSGPLFPARTSSVAQMINASLAKASHLRSLV